MVDRRILGGHLVEGALPQVAGEGQHVGLVHQREVAAGPGRGQVEGEAHAALDAPAGVDRPLGGHLVGRALAQHPALARVDALGVLPDDHEVEAVRRERTQVDVEVELEAQPEQQPPLEHARRHVGRAHRAEQDGVEPASSSRTAVGQTSPVRR